MFGLALIVLTPCGAVVVHTAVEAAAAMQKCTQDWKDNVITVDPASASVSYEQAQDCIVFSISSEHPFQFVKVSGLPAAFLDVQVHPRARQTQLKICKQLPPVPPLCALLPPSHLLLVCSCMLFILPADYHPSYLSHHVCRTECRCRLPHLRPPQHARALPAAACATRIRAVAARARARVAAAVVPRQHAARAAAVLLLPALYPGFSPASCRQQVWQPARLGALGRGAHHEALLRHIRVAALD
jgi:hypothetical protein